MFTSQWINFVLVVLYLSFPYTILTKPQLCERPPKWSVDEDGFASVDPMAANPMAAFIGNVTLVTLLKASSPSAHNQASRMGSMLRFLKKTGLRDIQFVIINNKEAASREDRNVLVEKVAGVGIPVYQETVDAPVWEWLEGRKDDMFIYDRCGRLNYYLPYPLSVLQPNKPIVHATILSAYFDNPCGYICEERRPPWPSSPAPATTPIDIVTNVNITAITKDFTDTGQVEGNASDVGITTVGPQVEEPPEDELIVVHESEEDIPPEEVNESGSGSGYIEEGDSYREQADGSDATSEPLTTGFSQSNVTSPPVSSGNSGLNGDQPEPWRIFSFFLGQPPKGRTKFVTSSTVAFKANDPQLLATDSAAMSSTTPSPAETSDLAQTSITLLTTIRPSNMSTVQEKPKPRPPPLTGPGCEAMNAMDCVDFSTDKLLRARLCCLKEAIGGDGEPTSAGCRKYPKAKCNRMLPLIKCCLKSFSQLLSNYFESQGNGRKSRPSYVS